MAEEDKKKKSKKPRKQRKDKGTKRKPTYIGAYREKEGRPTSKMEVLASGSSGLTGAKLGKSTRLAGVINSMKLPQMDNILSIQQELKKQQEDLKKQQEEFQKYFNKPSVAVVPKADVKQAQEEQSQQEVIASNKLKEFALKSNIKNRRKEIEQLKQQKEEETRLAQEAVARANEAELELRQMKEISDEMFQEVEIKKQEAETLTTQMRQQKIQYIFDTANALNLASLRTMFGNIPGEDIAGYRIKYLVSQGITEFKTDKKGKQTIFIPKEGVYEGEAFIPFDITQLEQERAQLEDQNGGLHDTVRELMMQREDAYAGNLLNEVMGEMITSISSELMMEGYERKVQEAKASEAEAYRIALSKQEELAQKEQEYQQLLGQAEEEYGGLKAQMEREGLTAQEQRMGLESEIRRLKEERDTEIAQGLAIKNAETERLEENIRSLQRGNEDLQAQTKRLQEEIDFKKQLMEGVVTKKEADELRKEIRLLKKDLEYAKEQGRKGDLALVKYQKEKMVLEQALTISKIEQKGMEQEQESAVTSIRQAMGARIENMRTREERQAEQIARMEEEFDEERQALRAQIVEEQTKRDLITQRALQAEEEYNTEAEWSNNVVGMMAEDLAGQQLRNIQASSRQQQLLKKIRESTLAEEQDRLRRERMREQKETQTEKKMREQKETQTEKKMKGEMETQTEKKMKGEMETQTENVVAELKAQPPLAPLLAPLQIPSSIPTNPIPPEQRVASPTSRIMAGSSSPKTIPPKEETGPTVRPKKSVKIKEKVEEPEDIKGIPTALADMSDEMLAQRIRERRNSTIPAEREKVEKYRAEIRRREQQSELRAEQRPLNLLSFDEMSREQQLQKLEEYKGRMKKNPGDLATAQKMVSLDQAIKRKNVMQPNIKEELRQKTGVAFETPIEQESLEARAVRERVRQRITMSQNPLQQDIPQAQEDMPATIIGNTLLSEFQGQPTSL